MLAYIIGLIFVAVITIATWAFIFGANDDDEKDYYDL